MSWGFSELSTSRSVPQRWHDTEFYVVGFVAGELARLTLDYGLRYSLFFNPTRADDKITSFVPALFNPALGNDPCNGLLQPPGTNLLQQAGARRRNRWPEPLADGRGQQQLRAARSVSPGTCRATGSPRSAPASGKFFLRERLTPVLNIATNPPFVTTRSRRPHARQHR